MRQSEHEENLEIKGNRQRHPIIPSSPGMPSHSLSSNLPVFDFSHESLTQNGRIDTITTYTTAVASDTNISIDDVQVG